MNLALHRFRVLAALPAGGAFGALDGFAAAVIEALHAFFPGVPVDAVQVGLVDVGGEEDVQALRLADEGGAVGGVFDQPALVDLEGGLEHVLFVGGQAVEMLDRPLIRDDRRPGVGVVAATLGQQLAQIFVPHRERPGQGFMRVGVGGVRFDPRRRAAGDDRDAGGRRDRHLVGEPLHHAVIGGIGGTRRVHAPVSRWPRPRPF